MAYLSRERLEAMGIAALGADVRISEKASVYNAPAIRLGNHVRIDDFAILSAGEGGIVIGDYVHIGCHSTLLGQAAIVMEDFSGLSGHVAVYSSSEDYSGACLTNPTVPALYRRPIHAPVRLGRHVIVGAQSVVLPGVDICDGAAVGALSLVSKSLAEPAVYAGNPARKLRMRTEEWKALEAQLRAHEG